MKGHAKLDEYEDIFIKGHEFIREPIKRHLPLVYPEEIFIFQTLRLKKHEKFLLAQKNKILKRHAEMTRHFCNFINHLWLMLRCW